MSNVDITPVLKAQFEAKSLKKWNTRDGGGYQFNLYHRGKSVAQVTNDGRGGEVEIDWTGVRYDGSLWTPPTLEGRKAATWNRNAKLAQAAKAELDAIVAATPPVDSRFAAEPLKVNVGWLTEELVNVTGILRLIKRGKTVFAEAGVDSEYYTVNEPYGPNMQAWIDQKYPGATVYNVKYAA